MLYNIEQIHSDNFQSRGSYKPFVDVFHITDGPEAIRTSDEHEENAVEYTFKSPDSKASANYDILRDGRIKQYVDVRQAAWTQGIAPDRIKDAPSAVVRQMGVNPNLYCTSYE